ncbi:MAG TPA: protein kinase [Vicinamibacterales bacterium]|nr:protein kinase [Vicinamibacterales bacterium]
MAFDIGTRLGVYELLGPLGSGGMGDVYQARDTRLQRIVAIKVLSAVTLSKPDARARFQREALAIGALNHPHICTLYDVGHEHGVDFIVMEHLEGETLAARLHRGQLPIDEALACARDIARAVDAAHRRGVIHRDLKPSNVMLTKAGAKLLDFGLAKLHRVGGGGDPELSTQTMDISGDSVIGTLRYMAPELFKDGEADARSDLFSLGAVFYELFTGVPPFRGNGNAQIIAAILTEEPKPIGELRPELPPALDWIVRTCLAKDPEDRWQGAREVVRQLSLLEQGQLGPATPTPVRAVTRRRRPRAALLAIGSLTVLVAGALAILVWQNVLPSMAADAAPAPHVVVLPCRPIGEVQATDRAHCDGLAAALTGSLSRLTTKHALQVTPSSEVHARAIDTAQQARHQLGATLALEGSLVRLGDGLRLTYALIDVVGSRQLDAITLAAGKADPFGIQDELVRWATSALRLTITGEQISAAQRTPSSDAHVFALQGQGYLLDYQRSGAVDIAIGLFQRAITADPRYAAAHAGLGEALWRKYELTKDATLVDTARAACRQALNLEPDLAAAHICAGTIASGTGEPEQAVVFLERALQLEPSSDAAYSLLARAQEQLGRNDAALATYARAVELRPQYWATHVWLGSFHRSRGNLAEAAREYERAAELTPDNAPVRGILAGMYTFLGRYEDAVAECQRSISLAPTPIAYNALGATQYRMRRFDDAVASLEKARSLLEDYRTVGNLARAYYWAGQRDRALQLFERAVELGERELAVNPRNDEVHLSLADFLARIGRGDEALKHLGLTRLENPHFMFFAAMVHAELGDIARGREWLDRAVAAGLPPAEVTGWIDVDVLRK